MSDVSSYDVGIEFETGSFTNVTNDVLQIDISRQLGNMIGGFVGSELNVEMSNQNGKYSHGSLSSLVRPNLPIKIKATHSGSVRTMFDGFIDEWSMTPQLDEPRNVTIAARDSWKILQRQTLTTSTRVNADIGSLYTEVMSLSNVSSFNVGEVARNIPFFFLNETTFDSAIQQMLGITHGYIYICPENCVRIEARHFDVLASTVDSLEDSGKCVLLNWTISDDQIFNKISVRTIPRKISTTITSIAAIEDPIAIQASGHVSFNLDYIDPVNKEVIPATEIQDLVSAQDWVVGATENGVPSLLSTASLSTTFFGPSVVNTLFNGADQVAFLSKYVVSGKPILRLSECTITIGANSSQSIYGTLQFTHSNDLIGGVNDATDFTAYLRNRYQWPHPNIDVVYRNDFPRILDLNIGSRIHFISSFMAVSSEFFVRELEHSIDAQAGWIHDTKYVLETIREFDGLVLDNSSLGILDGTRTVVF